MKPRKLLALTLLICCALALQGCTDDEPEMELVFGELFRDDFDSVVLGEHWLIGPELQHRQDNKWSLTANPGFLTITAQEAEIYEANNNPVNFFLYAVPYQNFEAVTRILFQPESDFEQAGLAIYQDMDNYARLSRVHAYGRHAVEPALETAGSYSDWNRDIANTAEIYLKLTKIDGQLSYYYSFDGIKWREVEHHPRVNWEQVYVVLYAISPVSGREVDAMFDYIEVRELKWEPVKSAL